MKLFIDTWGWIVLRNKRESRHAEVLEFYSAWSKQKGISYTTDYVLDETFTLLFRRLRVDDAKESVNAIDKGIERGYIRLERITAERFEKAKRLRMRFQDKPAISFTDFTSMVVMLELGIRDILTGDEHFTQVGMDFQKVP